MASNILVKLHRELEKPYFPIKIQNSIKDVKVKLLLYNVFVFEATEIFHQQNHYYYHPYNNLNVI